MATILGLLWAVKCLSKVNKKLQGQNQDEVHFFEARKLNYRRDII